MTSVDELLAESVRLYPVLYNKADKFFKDVNKKTLAWEDVAKKTGFPSGNHQTRMLVLLLFLSKANNENMGYSTFCHIVPTQIEVLNQDRIS